MTTQGTEQLEGSRRLDALGSAAAAVGGAGRRPPVHLWNPPFCGDIDMRIARDGTWYYAGTPIGRPALVRLFASVLRRDPDGMMLVTPVERVRIVVEDVPFVAVEMAVDPAPTPTLRLRTNVDDWVTVDEGHPMTFVTGAADGLKPYVEVRDGLLALVKRAVFYDLVALGEVRVIDGMRQFGIASAGAFFPMAPADTIDGLP